jgi:hypothetical protein
LPGETVKIKHEGVEICKTENNIEQCNTLAQPYLDASVSTEARCGIDTFVVDT